MNALPASTGLLGDTPERDYSRKLQQFNAFAEPELRNCIASLALKPGMRVLDAGCGTGEALQWLADEVAPGGQVVGIDLSGAHVAAARERVSPGITVLQGDLQEAAVPGGSFDLIWSVNTINHLRNSLHGVGTLTCRLRPGGRIALGQSSFVPDMYFAWDSRLERVTNEAVRAYYRERYGLEESAITAVRGLVGLLREAGLDNVQPRTLMIERTAPLSPADEGYLLESVFRDTWDKRLQPYLSCADYARLGRLCNPLDPQFALRRPDFHFLQSFTLVVGQVPDPTTNARGIRRSPGDAARDAARTTSGARGS